MRKIIIAVTCMLAILMICTSGLAKERVKPMKFTVETESGKKIKIDFAGYDESDKPIFLDKNGERILPIVDPPQDAENLISVLSKNPCYACSRSGCVVVKCR